MRVQKNSPPEADKLQHGGWGRRAHIAIRTFTLSEVEGELGALTRFLEIRLRAVVLTKVGSNFVKNVHQKGNQSHF